MFVDINGHTGYNMKMKFDFKFKFDIREARFVMKKIIALLSVIMISSLMLIGCATAGAEGEKLSIVVTDFPCYDFARAVAGDNADITMLIKPGSEVHSYEPSPNDVLSMTEADMFIYIGGESDSWVDGMLSSMGDDMPCALRMFGCVDGLETDDDDAHHGSDHHDDGHHEDTHHDHAYDEHIWTNPMYAIQMVDAIAVELCEIDPANAESYRANADSYIAQITEIDAAIRDITANSSRNCVVFGDRFPFVHMACEYGIDYCAAFPGCAAETEPSAQTIMELIDKVDSEHIPCVYVIEMSTGNVASAIAEETGAEIGTLHSVQNVSADEFNAGETYVSIMWKNVEALRKGLN